MVLFERIVAEGLAHNSYLIGSGSDAVVIDPRRDCGIYCKIAQKNGLTIRHIFETHRNEDYVAGSLELQERHGTGCPANTGPMGHKNSGNKSGKKKNFIA